MSSHPIIRYQPACRLLMQHDCLSGNANEQLIIIISPAAAAVGLPLAQNMTSSCILVCHPACGKPLHPAWCRLLLCPCGIQCIHTPHGHTWFRQAPSKCILLTCPMGIARVDTSQRLPAVRQVRAMRIIDELEVNKHGPYGGGMGYLAYNGNMDIALALRTMVIPNPPPSAGTSNASGNGSSKQGRKEWTVHLQVSTLYSPQHQGCLLLARSCD